jgi:hypothetical protein
MATAYTSLTAACRLLLQGGDGIHAAADLIPQRDKFLKKDCSRSVLVARLERATY